MLHLSLIFRLSTLFLFASLQTRYPHPTTAKDPCQRLEDSKRISDQVNVPNYTSPVQGGTYYFYGANISL